MDMLFPDEYLNLKQKARLSRCEEIIAESAENTNPLFSSLKNISYTFWGKQWVKAVSILETHQDRLRLGRTILRHKGLLDHSREGNTFSAVVWTGESRRCSFSILPWGEEQNSLMSQSINRDITSIADILDGKLSDSLSRIFSEQGLLLPNMLSIKPSCECIDDAPLCSHIACALYGFGIVIDHSPLELFLIRGINLEDHINPAVQQEAATPLNNSAIGNTNPDLQKLFNIDFDEGQL